DDSLGVLADIDESARAYDLVAKTADIDVASLVDFGKRKKGKIEPATVIEIKLIGLVDHRLIVTSRARLVAGRRYATDQALLVGEHDVVDRVFLGGQRCNSGRDPGAEIAD